MHFYSCIRKELSDFPDFVRYESEAGSYLSFSFDPENKHVDAFIATESRLPILLHPKYYPHKWRKLLEKGFYMFVNNNLTMADDGSLTEAGKKLFDCISLRTQTKLYDKQNRGLEAPLVLGKKQKFKNRITGSEETMPEYLTGTNDLNTKDVFMLYPRFDVKPPLGLAEHIESFKCSIQKGKEHKDQEWEEVPEWQDVSYSFEGLRNIVIAGKDGCVRLNGKIDRSKTFTFLDGEVYKVKVELELVGGGKEKFEYKFYYTDDEQSMNLYSRTNESSDDLFGVPTSY